MIGLLRRLSCKGHTRKPLHVHSGLLGDRAHWVSRVVYERLSWKGHILVTQWCLCTFLQVLQETAYTVNMIGLLGRLSCKGHTWKTQHIYSGLWEDRSHQSSTLVLKKMVLKRLFFGNTAKPLHICSDLSVYMCVSMCLCVSVSCLSMCLCMSVSHWSIRQLLDWYTYIY